MDERWEQCAFPGEFRRYQSLALRAFEQLEAAGQRRLYLVLPPGAGKTVLGLEVARRLGRRTLVLSPNTAVQGQWLREWSAFAPPGGPHPQPGSSDRSLESALTVLTYQALSVWDRTADDEDVEDDSSPATAAKRRAAVRGESGTDLLDLLHPRGRELVQRAAELGPWTLVLDECHHLLETWGALVRALARALGDDTWVVGLTATPPRDMTARQQALHDELFGDCDFLVPTPAVVKEGELAPFQELVYLTAPTEEEDTWIASERTRFADLQVELLSTRRGSMPFAVWLLRRLEDRRPVGGGPRLAWSDLEAAEPALARAGLRLVQSGLIALPAGARLREEHKVPADAEDWAVLLEAFAREHLAPSADREDHRLLAGIRNVLPGLGFSLTVRGLRSAPSPVDRVCALSASKAAAAVHILGVESAALGEDLRAVVLCDFEHRTAEQPAALRSAVSKQAGSARLALLALASSDLGGVLRPVLCTGRTLAMRRSDLVGFRASAAVRAAGLSHRLVAEPLDGNRNLVSLDAGSGWTARVWAPLVTAWLEEGGTQAVIGTRALLGEGWDCPPVNVLVDLTSAATPLSVTQLRGRSLRLDPARPDKVADNWTVVCVTDDHPRGDADYLRAVRKHEAHLAPGPSREIESGIGHCDEALGPYAPPSPEDRVAITARALRRAAERPLARKAWGVGEPYRGSELTTVRLRVGRALGLPAGFVPTPLLAPRTTLGTDAPAPTPRDGRPVRLWPLPAATAVVVGSGLTVAESAPVGAAGAVGSAAVVGGVVAGVRYRRQLQALRDLPTDGQSDALRQLASAVADALHAAGGSSAGASALVVRGGQDGWLTCELDVPERESALFATSLDELLAPLGDPRWLVSRLVLPVPAAAADRRRLARARALGRPVEAAVAWHAVPTWLGRNKARVQAFDDAWRRHVGPGRLVLARDEEGEVLLGLLRGADPFAVTSRLRTLWR